MTRVRMIAPAALAALIASAACNNTFTGTTTSPGSVTAPSIEGISVYIETANGITPNLAGTLHSTNLPAVTSGQPAAQITGSASAVLSGANTLTVTSGTAFSSVVLSIGGVP